MKLKAVILLCTALVFLSGCSGETAEVRERVYVQSAVLDASEKTSLTLFMFEGTENSVEGVGTDVFSAADDAAVKSGREIFLWHTELLCLTSPVDSEYLTSCLGEYRLSPGCRLLLLHTAEISEETDTTALTDSLKLETEKGRIPETDLFTVLQELQGTDGTALVPVLTDQGFSMGITDGSDILGVLSEKAVKGLVWLRGDNFPERLPITGDSGTESFEVYSADTDLSAEIVKGIPHIRAEIRIRGKGNTEAARQLVKAYCLAAIEETVKGMKADVIGLDACLARDCPEYFAQLDFYTAMTAADFEVIVREK